MKSPASRIRKLLFAVGVGSLLALPLPLRAEEPKKAAPPRHPRPPRPRPAPPPSRS
ncbi:MAG TPA: hypothetical protein PLL76_01570 [Thermoanaerobaculia bacterium]|nr:hypothetical protein [Thermoanaerobaculia bacterium]